MRLQTLLAAVSGLSLLLAAACGSESGATFRQQATDAATQRSGRQARTESLVATPTPQASAAASPAASTPRPPSAAAAAAAAPAGPIDTCRLVTREEVEASTGYRVGPAERHGPECFFRAGDDVTITIAVLRDPTARSSWSVLRDSTAGGTEDVQGLGDRAFIAYGLMSVSVLKGDLLLDIQVADRQLSHAEMRATLIGLAQSAVARL